MYKKNIPTKTHFSINNSTEGERIEQKIMRITQNKEPIKDGAPIIYTERQDGVHPITDIRTDRWDLAADAQDKLSKSNTAKREQAIGERTYDTMTEEQQKDFHTKYPSNKHNKPKPSSGTNTNDGGK